MLDDGLELWKYDGRVWLVGNHLLDCTLDRFNLAWCMALEANPEKITFERR
jgi:hypothetical protein